MILLLTLGAMVVGGVLGELLRRRSGRPTSTERTPGRAHTDPGFTNMH